MPSTLPPPKFRSFEETGSIPPYGATPRTTSSAPFRLFGLAMVAAGITGWWYNWHLAQTQGEFYLKLTIFGPLAVAGGLLMAIRPEWAGPLRLGSSRAHKIALFAVIGFMFVFSGIDFYRLKHSHS